MSTLPVPQVVPLVSVRNLRRSFGKVLAVDNISFQIAKGAVTGFIGANGAGKTTTMRVLATLELPDSGEVFIDGTDALGFPNEIRHRIGWMPDNYGAYRDMSVHEYLDFFARGYGQKGASRRARVRDVMDFTDLTPLADREITKLSKGMGQRLCLGRTLLHDPEFLILDEPAAGLDPKARVEFKNLIAQLKEWKKTVLISSHILSELSEMCDEMLFIDKGRVLHHGSADSLLVPKTGRPRFTIGLESGVDRFIHWIDTQPDFELDTVLPTGARVKLSSNETAVVAETLARIVHAGFPVVEFHKEETRLEDAFIRMVKEAEFPPPLPPAQ